MDMPEPREREKLLQAQGAAALETATPLATLGEIEVWSSNNGGWIALAWINRRNDRPVGLCRPVRS